ncbi:DsbA family protein [Corticimicrobacter populi]|uniref:Protein-disulfide isomerase n=1 Tax=Corticimicrobacter populi TaxID=2175229 RepID=A0A2V1K1X1_9BURK|nr:DsbA family protein [Corticimicrobacter populi]PWF24116.1 protein-disulfide isomerase [Corticimicrobacter populi]
MSRTIHYIYDPLCGWCYGALPALQALQAQTGITLQMHPSGLFSGAGARPMDSEFATYAWRNDQRIASLTGQRFTERYRSQILETAGLRFDSGPATLALTAVHLAQPERELDALQAIQQTRYIDGLDTTRTDVLVTVLQAQGLGTAATLLTASDENLQAHNLARVEQARSLMQQLGARGVPSLAVNMDNQLYTIDTSEAYTNPQAFAHQLATA